MIKNFKTIKKTFQEGSKFLYSMFGLISFFIWFGVMALSYYDLGYITMYAGSIIFYIIILFVLAKTDLLTEKVI